MKSRTIAAACAAAALLVAAAPAPAQSQTIQPGVAIEADGSYCTLAWIFYGPGGQYGSTAAHCVTAVGQQVNLAEGALLGTLGRIGEVAFRGDENVPGRDYAFIKLDDAVLSRVSGKLKGWPAIPTGISTSATASAGDLIQFSGHGVGFSLTQPT